MKAVVRRKARMKEGLRWKGCSKLGKDCPSGVFSCRHPSSTIASPACPRSHVNFSLRSRDVTAIPKLLKITQTYSRAGGGTGYSGSTLHGLQRCKSPLAPGSTKPYQPVPPATSSPNSGEPPRGPESSASRSTRPLRPGQTWSTPFLGFIFHPGYLSGNFILIASRDLLLLLGLRLFIPPPRPLTRSPYTIPDYSCGTTLYSPSLSYCKLENCMAPARILSFPYLALG